MSRRASRWHLLCGQEPAKGILAIRGQTGQIHGVIRPPRSVHTRPHAWSTPHLRIGGAGDFRQFARWPLVYSKSVATGSRRGFPAFAETCRVARGAARPGAARAVGIPDDREPGKAARYCVPATRSYAASCSRAKSRAKDLIRAHAADLHAGPTELQRERRRTHEHVPSRPSFSRS